MEPHAPSALLVLIEATLDANAGRASDACPAS
jgi:hypothetical protein